jgi:hypothetical protein
MFVSLLSDQCVESLSRAKSLIRKGLDGTNIEKLTFSSFLKLFYIYSLLSLFNNIPLSANSLGPRKRVCK